MHKWNLFVLDFYVTQMTATMTTQIHAVYLHDIYEATWTYLEIWQMWKSLYYNYMYYHVLCWWWLIVISEGYMCQESTNGHLVKQSDQWSSLRCVQGVELHKVRPGNGPRSKSSPISWKPLRHKMDPLGYLLRCHGHLGCCGIMGATYKGQDSEITA